ncbi:ankyrin repeat domain-containing protein [Pseudomonas sp. 2FG]|uniref:ankyrin repeat domain-containing protein n=1 Tax=Pseudomonas sp. 2FG TaxID=2502191 RepID=UPI0010F70A69|nr:ankyrin repeat domain-containing protein [Pseudomonas sp. 2FG]
MKQHLLVAALATTLVGCGSDYTTDEVKTKDDMTFKPTSTYVEKDSGDLVSGRIIKEENGVVVLEFEIADGKVNGAWIERNEKGQVVEVHEMDHGKYTGDSKNYCSGNPEQLISHVNYDNPLMTVKGYDCDTGLQTIERVQRYTLGEKGNGMEVGEQKRWDIKDGKQILRIVERHNTEGMLDGVTEVYWGNGAIQERSNYKNGKQNGTKEFYAQQEDGASKLQTVEKYVDGKLEGEKVEYILSDKWPAETVGGKWLYKDGKRTSSLEITSTSKMISFNTAFKKDNAAYRQRLQGEFNWATGYNITDLEALSYLIDNSGSAINDPLEGDGRTAIHYVPVNGFDMLRNKGADVNLQDGAGKSRLMHCFESNSLRCSPEHMLRLITEFPSKVTDLYGNSALHYFCMASSAESYRGKNDSAIMDALIKTQDVNAKNNEGKMALHYCMSLNRDLAVQLVDAGADLNAKDAAQIAPLQYVFITNPHTHSLARGIQIQWDAERIELVSKYVRKGNVDLQNEKFPGFEKSLKQLMIDNGDPQSAMAMDRLSAPAKS